MTPRQIEKLIVETKGPICARISRRPDGSLVMLESKPRPHLAATLALSSALTFAATAAAQSVAAHPTAVLTGKVLVPDGSSPAAGAQIILISDGTTVAQTKTDTSGAFSVEVPPGRYDIHIQQSVMFGARIQAADLHEGQQAIPALKPHFNYVFPGEGATMGELAPIIGYPIRYALRHPLRYVKYRIHR